MKVLGVVCFITQYKELSHTFFIGFYLYPTMLLVKRLHKIKIKYNSTIKNAFKHEFFLFHLFTPFVYIPFKL